MPVSRCRRVRGPGLLLLAILVAVLSACAGPAASDGRSADEPYPPPRPPPPRNPLSLGAILVTNSPSWGRLLPRPATRGALVVAVLPRSPAEQVRISPGDVIATIDGVQVSGSDGATLALASSPGLGHTLLVSRPGGAARVVHVETAPPILSSSRYLEQRSTSAPDGVTRFLYASASPRPAPALSLIDEVIAGAPQFAPARALRAQRLLDMAAPPPPPGYPPEVASAATGELARAVELDPTSAEVRTIAAQVYLRLGLAPAAESAAVAALAGDAGSALAHRLLGLARLSLGRPDAALPDLRRAVDLDPYTPGHYQDLARAYSALGRTGSAAATLDALRAMRSRGTSGPRWGPRAVAVSTAAAVLAAVIAIPLLMWRRKHPLAGPVAEPADPSGERRAIGVVEALAVLGGWATAIPLVSPALGLAPESTPRLEIADHVVPGLVVVAVSAICLAVLLRPARREHLLPLVPAVTFLAGFWITSTHVPLLVQAYRHVRPWSLALFHSSAGPPIVVCSVWLYRLLARAGSPVPEATSLERSGISLPS